MELARAVASVRDFEAEIVALYPALTRRLALVLRDGDAAQDIAQATVARALEQQRRFSGSDVRAWVYTIGLRLAFNELRRRRTIRSREATEEPSWAMETDPDLWRALVEIEPRRRAALLLSVLEGYTHADIGRILGVPEGTVSSWLSRTKDRLRLMLAEDER
jgi:RNA polymerase sigma-70 factor (ECF subfamily)